METEIRNMLRDRAAGVDLPAAIPAATVQRARQRRVMNSVVALTTAAALVIGAVVGVNALRNSSEIEYVNPPIVPKKITAIPVGGQPAEVAIGFGSVWVERQDELVRIDQRTNRVVARIVPQSEPRVTGEGAQEVQRFFLGTQGIAVGEGAVWVTASGGFTEFRMTATTFGEIPGPTQTAGPGGSSGVQFTATAQPITGTLSASSGPHQGPSRPPEPTTTPDPSGLQRWSLLRIDPGDNTFTEHESIGGFMPTALAAGEGAVWVAATSFPDGGAVYRIDPRTNGKTPIPIATDGAPSGIAVLDRFVWVAVGGNGADANSVLKINPRTNKVVQRIRIPEAIALQDVAAADGSVWATALFTEGRSAVARIDARTGTLLRLVPLERPIVRLVAAGPSGVWVSTQDDDQLFRIDPRLSEVTGRLSLDGVPEDLAAAGSSVWVIADPDASARGNGPKAPTFVRFDL